MNRSTMQALVDMRDEAIRMSTGLPTLIDAYLSTEIAAAGYALVPTTPEGIRRFLDEHEDAARAAGVVIGETAA